MPQALLIARDMQNQLRRIPVGLRAWMPLSPQTVNDGRGYNESDDFPSSKVEDSVCIIMLIAGAFLTAARQLQIYTGFPFNLWYKAGRSSYNRELWKSRLLYHYRIIT